MVDAIPYAPLRRAMQLHHFVALERLDGTCDVLDFLPLDPTSPVTALKLALQVGCLTELLFELQMGEYSLHSP